MCDYSLQNVASTPAKVGDKLVTQNFGTGTRGFACVDDPKVAVCVLPGTEIAFDKGVKSRFIGGALANVVIFRQRDKDLPMTHHDVVEFPDGRQVLLTELEEGQTATVLQLPAAPKTEKEAEEQKRIEFVG